MDNAPRRDSFDARHLDGVVRATTRQAFRSDVVPLLLTVWRAEPERLAEAILTALEAGLAADVVAAAEHLGRIDADRRRRTWIPALVLCHAGRFKKAEELLMRGRELFGDCADLRYLEAEVSFARHLRAKGEAALAAALDADPNHPRALRLCVRHYRGTAGAAASRTALETVAEHGDAWRARLLLSEELFSAGEMAEARRFASEAAACATTDAVLGPLSAVLARQHDSAGLVELVLPRYDASRHGSRCGVNLLFGLLESGHRAEGEALVAAIRAHHADAFPRHLAFYASAFKAIDPESKNDPRSAGSLHRALAAHARHETESSRRAMVRALLASVLLLPLHQPVVDVPIFDLGLPEPSEPSIEAVTAVDSTGRVVTLAFTAEKALAAWNPSHHHRIALDAKELLELVRSLGGGALVINGAGPASLELSPDQIDALIEGTEFPLVATNAEFLVEPLRDDVPPGFLENAEKVVRSTAAIREGFLFEIISERDGASPAFAILFDVDADTRTIRDAVLEAKDRLVWERGRKKRRVHVMPLREGALAEFLQFCAIRVD